MDFESFVLAGATVDLAEEPNSREYADALEFRMDLADEPLDQLDDYHGDLPVIATNRVEWDGGEAPDDTERIDALLDAVVNPAVESVDVELDAVLDGDADRVVDRARETGVSVIVSSHDFEAMPDRDGIRRAIERATAFGDVAKFAGTAETVGDALDLLTVTYERTERGDTVATMAMGEPGRHTRAIAPLYGSKVGYAPLDPARATAPGQYDLATLRSLVDLCRTGTED